MVSAMCRVRIIDFAHLKACSGMYSIRMLYTFRKRTVREFSDREAFGALQYRAPELLRRFPYGRTIDWWAVGVNAFLMKFGRVPFQGGTEADLITEILSGDVQAMLERGEATQEQVNVSPSANSQKTTDKLYNDIVQRLLRVKTSCE